MKQVFQDISNGNSFIEDVPDPTVRRGHLLIRTSRSLISAGTEKMLVSFGKASYINKARQQPEKVKMVLDKVRADGVVPTIKSVKSKLSDPMPMGYSNVGTVVAVGDGVSGFRVGDRVASNGRHAEIVCVPENLCARVPDEVSDDQACFTVLGAIGLQGVRLAEPTLGERFVVYGLGLIGLLAVQILRANGCRVLGVDIDETRVAQARSLGAETVNLANGEDLIAAADEFTGGKGVDGVLITASTSDNSIVSNSAEICRKRGRIVLVGVVGLSLNRSDFYEKELSFQVSCSYGPGRYDSSYEADGHDYPFGFVRWTQQRNFEAVLGLMAEKGLTVDSLISHRFSIEAAPDAYSALESDAQALGILLDYPAVDEAPASHSVEIDSRSVEPVAGSISVSSIGAGSYASSVLLPAFRRAGARLHAIVGQGGASSVHVGKKLGFELASTSITDALDDETDAVVVATRHDSHAKYVLESLKAGKHVFVEKPLCLNLDDCNRLEQELRGRSGSLLMVGFNRRFAPLVRTIKERLATTREPKSMVMTVNAGAIPPDHWTQDPSVGGGRLVGEACHFIDLLRFLADAPVKSTHVASLAAGKGIRDTVSISLEFDDGSMGTIHYLANGHRQYPKERLDVFCGGRILQLDNFKKLRGWGWPGFSKRSLWAQDKGQQACVSAYLEAISTGGASPIPVDEILEISRVSINVQEMVS